MRSRRWLLALPVLGGLAGVLWRAVSPSTIGVVGPVVIAYPVPDDPAATVTALYVLICGVAGLLVGVPVVAMPDRFVVRRLLLALGGGLAAAALAYAVGFGLGPGTVAAQVAAQHGVEHPKVQVPLVLASPLLVLVWPAATAALVTIGLVLHGMLTPDSRFSRTDARLPSPAPGDRGLTGGAP